MKLNVWYEEDIRRNLEAALAATDLIGATANENALPYRQGYLAALNIVSLGFGIDLHLSPAIPPPAAVVEGHYRRIEE